ncbi:MAG: hypothetical protein CMJ54_03550 [Planctomycetaceae bacterium]|nr:hypothetical protein [Planctomycetaceae bacterium]
MPSTIHEAKTKVEVKTVRSGGKAPGPSANAKGRGRRRRSRFGGAMKMFRRTHMYFGLLLVPFVLLYGVTAILFNHPTWFNTAVTTSTIEPEALGEVSTLSAPELAEELRASLETEVGAPVGLVEDPAPRFRGTVLVEYREDGLRRRYRVNPETLATTLERRSLPIVEAEETPVFPEKLETSAAEGIEAIRDAVARMAATDGGVVRAAPDLDFHLEVDGERWTMEYDTRSKSLSARREGEPRSAFDLRSFLMRLHVSRGYPADVGVRSLWGVLVDTTAALMIFWGLSGIIMWWQIKPTRFNGGIAIAMGVAMAGGLAVGMFFVIHH